MQYTYFASSKEQGTIRGRLNRVCDVLDKLHEQKKAVWVTIEALQAQGATEATLHWRRPVSYSKPGILELLHPQDSEYTRQTGRRREYIGTDTDKQQEAIARVKRWKALQEARAEERRIRGRMDEIERRIGMLELAAAGKQTDFGDTWFEPAVASSPQINE